MSQFNFDIMDSAGYGYYRVWVERRYLLKLAIIPFLIKFACTVVVMVLGYENNILRQGLILLPGDIAEGWLLAQFLRTLLKNERWPTVLPLDMDEKVLDKLLLRARGIVAATLVYALVSLTAYFMRFCVFGQFIDSSPISEQDVSTVISAAETDKTLEIHPLYIIPMAAAAVASFWGFRLMWLYIPFSVLMPVSDYLKALGGFMASVKMMVLFFCSMAPTMFITIMLSRVLFNAVGGIEDGSGSISQFAVLFLAVFAEVMVALVTTAAFVWAMRGFLPKNPDLLKEMPKLGE